MFSWVYTPGARPYDPGTMKHWNRSKTLSGIGLAASLLLAGAAHADPGVPQVLADGGTSHHHALHTQNPIFQRYKGFYPRRVHITLEDSDGKFTVLNETKEFQVLEGHYGVPNLLVTMPDEDVEKVYEMVRSGSMPEGIPRVEMAMLVKEYSETSLDNPQSNDPKKPGKGPKLRKFERFLGKFIAAKNKGVKFMGKAGEAQANKKTLPKLYYGLISKLAFKSADKMMKKTAAKLMKELGRDLEDGKMALTPKGYWSTFVDMHCFFNMVQSPQHFGDVCAEMVQRIQGVLVYHKTLPQTEDLATRTQILEDRLALVEKLVELADT